MSTFAQYILGEPDFIKKIEIVHFLRKKQNIFFNNTVLLKAELAREFMDIMDIDVDRNLVLTACLMYSCLKNDSPEEIERIKNAPEADKRYLKSLGFSDRFCKICTEHSRYLETDSNIREKESDIVELVDQFGGMITHRQDRLAYSVEEAAYLLKNKNLKNTNNRYLDEFEKFIDLMEDIEV